MRKFRLRPAIVWNYIKIFLFVASSTVWLYHNSTWMRNPEDVIIAEFASVAKTLNYSLSPGYSKPVIPDTAIAITHVALEFGPASMGGLGRMLTDLSVAQTAACPDCDISVIVPYYSFLRPWHFEAKRFEYCTTISIEVDSWKVSSWWQILRHLSFKSSISVPVFAATYRQVTVFLVGASDVYPLSLAFSATSKSKIYDVQYGLSHAWQTLYFYYAAAAFLDLGLVPQDRVVNLHGATSALTRLACGLSSSCSLKPFRFVYVIHDYSYEFSYSLTRLDISAFMPTSKSHDALMQSFTQNGFLYPSGIGIALSHALVFVSTALLREIANPASQFTHKTAVAGVIMQQIRSCNAHIIRNGISLSDISPFDDPHLQQFGLIVPPLTDIGRGSEFQKQKSAAKLVLGEYAVLPKVITSNTPVFLFVGRFTREKGIDVIIEMSSSITANGAHLIIMGQPLNHLFDSSILHRLRDQNPDSITLIDDNDEQSRWGSVIRLAADYMLVPSRSESFGLVAVEGLLFGSIIVSSGVGGLSEFLTDGDNSLLYGAQYHRTPCEAITLALAHYNVGTTTQSEHIKRNVLTALGMRWHSKGDVHSNPSFESFNSENPADQYLLLYRTLLKKQRSDDHLLSDC